MATAHPSAPPSGVRVRRPNQIRKLYLSEICSGAGDGIFWVALITAISGEPRFELLLAAVVLVRLGPRALLSVIGGRLVERSDVHTLLVTIDVLRMLAMFGVALAYAWGANIWLLLGGVLVSYVLGVPTRSALATSLPYIVGETQLAGANATVSLIRQLMTFLGPLIGVAIVAWSTTAGFVANGVAFGLSALSIALVRDVRWPGARRESGAAPTGVPARSARLRAVTGFVPLVALIGVMYLVRGVEMVVHVLVIRELLDTGPTAIGVFGAAIGVGAIASTPFARRAAAAGQVTGPIVFSVALTALPTAGLLVCTTLGTAAALLVFVGAGMVMFEVVSVITIQRSVPRASYGRAFGAVNGASNLGKLLGAVAAPAVVELVGLEATILAVSIVVAIAGLAAVPSLRSVEATAGHQRDALRPIVESLGDIALFDGATPIALERLASEVTEQRVAAATTLIREGDRPDDLFVTIDGDLSATVGGTEVGSLHAGDWFGEIGLVERTERTATVTTTTDAIVWRIPGQVFLDVLEDSGAAPSALTQGIADRLAVHHDR